MTVTNHTLAGVGVATLVSNPWIGLPAAFVSHLILDTIPHLGLENADNAKEPTVVGAVVLDTIIALIILIVAINALTAPAWYLPAAALVSLSPDFLHPIRWYTGKELLPRFQRFHDRIQWSETPQGAWIDIVVAITFSAVIFF